MLIERKNRLENTIQSLKSERVYLDASIAESEGQEEQITNLKEFISEVAEGISIVENDFSTKHKILELLDMQVNLTIEDGEKVIYANCILKKNGFPIAPTNTNTYKHNIQTGLTLTNRIVLSKRLD